MLARVTNIKKQKKIKSLFIPAPPFFQVVSNRMSENEGIALNEEAFVPNASPKPRDESARYLQECVSRKQNRK